MLISIVIPTLNEEKNIEYVLKDIGNFFSRNKYRYEVIIIDGYSSDKTIEIAKKYNAKIFYDEKGKGSALRKGMKLAKGNIIIMMDADCSMRVNEFPLLIAGIEAGYDICMGSRFIQGGGTEDMPWYRKLGNKFFVFLVNFFWGMNYSDLCYGFRSMRKNVTKKLNLKSDGFGIETEISIKSAKLRYKVLEIPSFEKKRKYGNGKLRSFKDGFIILMTIFKELIRNK